MMPPISAKSILGSVSQSNDRVEQVKASPTYKARLAKYFSRVNKAYDAENVLQEWLLDAGIIVAELSAGCVVIDINTKKSLVETIDGNAPTYLHALREAVAIASKRIAEKAQTELSSVDQPSD
jgi:hypothetical protein